MQKCQLVSWRDMTVGGVQPRGTRSVIQNPLVRLGHLPQGTRKRKRSCWRGWLLLPVASRHQVSSWHECQNVSALLPSCKEMDTITQVP